MSRFLTFITAAFVALALSSSPIAQGGEVGAIKRFVSFPVDTFELSGNMSPVVLEEATTPTPSEISVDGWWGDKKLLLISFAIGNERESYYVHFRAVEMNDQAAWDSRLRATGGLVCLGGSTRRAGRNPNTRVAASKGFDSPC